MISVIKQLLLLLCLFQVSIAIADPKIIELHSLDLDPHITIVTPDSMQESRPLSYKAGEPTYVDHYRLSNGRIIKNCFKIPMKYRSFDIQHTHLRCANGADYYVK